MKHILIGEYGEQLALKYLKKKKYKIIAHNYTNKLGELDIIARDQQYIVIVEVKTRSTGAYGFGYEAVTPAKQQKIKQVTQLFLMEHNLMDQDIRFDVISVDGDKIEHFINAFE